MTKPFSAYMKEPGKYYAIYVRSNLSGSESVGINRDRALQYADWASIANRLNEDEAEIARLKAPPAEPGLVDELKWLFSHVERTDVDSVEWYKRKQKLMKHLDRTPPQKPLTAEELDTLRDMEDAEAHPVEKQGDAP